MCSSDLVRLQSHRETREELDAKILEFQTQRAGTESELKALQGIFREELGYGSDGEGADVSIREQCSLIQAALAERMDVDEDVEQATEVALGEHLQAWIVRSPQEAQESIAQFQQHQFGKGCFLSLQVPRDPHVGSPHWWAALEHDPVVKGLARTFVHAPTELTPVVDGLLQDTVIVGSLADAMDLMDKHEWFHGHGPSFVTLNGEVVSSLGVMSGGSNREAGGLLRRRREILTLEESLTALQSEFKIAQETRKVLCQDIEAVSSKFEEAISAIRETELQVFSVQKEEMSKGQALPDLLRRLDILQQERDMEEAELERMQADEADTRKQLEALAHRRTEEDAIFAQAQDTLQTLDDEQEDLTLRLNDIRMNHHTLNAQLGHEQSNKERMEREEEHRKIRVQEIDQQLEHLFLQSRASQDERLKNEELVETLGRQKESKGGELRDLQNRHAEILEEVKRLDSLIARAREALAQIFKSRAPIEGHLAEVRTKLQAVEETLTQTYEISTDDLTLSQSQGVAGNDEQHTDMSDDVDEQGPEQWREHLQRIRKKLERIGPINLAAIDEHVQLDERYQFLLTQEEDLAGSIQSLQEIIQRLNQTTNKLFAETFKELQVKFNEVFSALFAGGRAELVLVYEAENPSQESESVDEIGRAHV